MIKVKNRLWLPLAIFCMLHIGVRAEKIPQYKNPKLSVEKRVSDLIGRMSVEEKVYQMCALRLGEGDEIFKSSGVYSIDYVQTQFGSHGIGSLSCPTTDMRAEKSIKTVNEIQRIAVEKTRLGIPAIINDEALHGCMGRGSTSYPQSIALSCTWNLELMGQIADAVVMMFFAGEEGANALGEILAGKVNPSGKLTLTIPRHTGQLPMSFIQRPYGREGNFAEYPDKKKINSMAQTKTVTIRYSPLGMAI